MWSRGGGGKTRWKGKLRNEPYYIFYTFFKGGGFGLSVVKIQQMVFSCLNGFRDVFLVQATHVPT